jgi:diguanylate cyclase (GGDEF)-like protein
VRIARYALAVGQARGYEVATAQARYLYAISGCHWFESIENDVRHAHIAREELLRSGDLQSTCFTFYPAIFALVDYAPALDELASEIDTAVAFAARTGNNAAAAVQMVYRQFVRAMRGQTDQPGGFTDASFDEDTHLKFNRRVAAHQYIYRALSAAVFGDAAALIQHAAAAMAHLSLLLSLYPSVVAHLVQALALAHRARTATPQQRPALFAELDTCRAWLAARAQDAPENYRHLLLLVEAERACAIDDFRAAAIAYDASLREVETRQRPWHRALIAERAGLFHLAHGLEWLGRSLLCEARARYGAWGATGKVHELDRVHPFLRPVGMTVSEGPRPDHTHSGGVSSDDIDMLAILRASQALSSETSLECLYASVADQMRAITGATTVQLLLFDDDVQDWVMPAATGDREAPIAVHEAGARGLLPVTAFRYAERTRQPLLVENASRDDRFARDPYLAGVDCCSLLVVPILKQGIMRAVLLLENRLSSGAFSADRLDAVTLIASQLAVCIDNALLYRRLEDKVAERTMALQAANEQLETLSLTEPLTGLANRRRFDDVLAVEWRRAFAARTSIGVVMIDIDHFKRYNDKYGHLAGDECLCKVAAVLAASIRRDIDLVCRYGGEEFAIIFPGADEASAADVAERARAAVAALAQPHAHADAGYLTLSAGAAATVPTAEYAAAALVKAADTALYQAKQHGRNQVWTASGPRNG